MKKQFKFAVVGATVLVIGAMSVTAFAASSYSTPAEAAAGLTGRTVESVIEERTQTGKSYGTITSEAGKLEEFQDEMLEMRKDALQERVAAGTMTQERADSILAAMEQNQANCDGSAAGGLGRRMGGGTGCLGTGTGGMGMRAGGGQGFGRSGAGCGTGICTGTCTET